MIRRWVLKGSIVWAVSSVLGVGAQALAGPPGSRNADRDAAGTTLPLHQIAPQWRAQVMEVVSEPTLHHKAQPETFPCHPQLYMALLNDPEMTLGLWQDLSSSPARLKNVGPGRYQGSDGAGTTASWQFVVRTPKLHVLFCDLDYVGPRGKTHLEGRIVLVVRTGYYKEVTGEPWVQHEVEAFVKVDSRGWRAVAKTAQPVLKGVLEEQLKQAGWFVSLMGRLVENYPNWAVEVVTSNPALPPQTQDGFRQVVDVAKRPNASSGRPVANGASAGEKTASIE